MCIVSVVVEAAAVTVAAAATVIGTAVVLLVLVASHLLLLVFVLLFPGRTVPVVFGVYDILQLGLFQLKVKIRWILKTDKNSE